MSTQFNGKAGEESRVTFSVSSSTDTSPIEVTATAAHGLLTGDRVQILNHTTNVAANRVAYVLVTSSTKFKLYAAWTAGAVATPIAGSGAGAGAGGTAYYQGLGPHSTIPDDGVDLRTAAALNAPNEDAKNGQAWLAERTGAYRLVRMVTHNVSNAPATSSATGASGSSVWGTNTAAGGISKKLNAAWADYLEVEEGDLVEVSLTGTIEVSGALKVAFRFAFENADYGVALTGTPTETGFAAQTIYGSGPLSLHEVLQVGAYTHGHKCMPVVQDYGVGAANNYDAVGDLFMTWKVWRSNA